jgi:serine/threonine protein kinase
VSGSAVQEAAPLTERPVTRLGAYHLFASLGQGGMASVYLAAADGVQGARTLCVVKCLHPSLAQDERVVAMFLGEARLAVRLHHPNVVQTFGAGECDGTHFIAMEYLEGQPLQRLAKRQTAGQPFNEALWLHVICEVLAGLDYAHELADYDGRPLGIVHRDVSPQNIFLTYAGQVQILDFGIAKAALNTTKTEEGAFKGKVSYVAPEQILSGRTVDRRADIFATGIVLWELLTAKRLFKGDLETVVRAIVGAPIPRVSSIVKGIDPRLDAIVARALEKDPNARYQTAAAMRSDIEAYRRSTGKAFGPRDVENTLLSLYAERREARAAEVRGVMQRLDEQPEVPDLESLSPLKTATRPGGRSRGGATSSGVQSSPRNTTNPTGDRLAMDLAELDDEGTRSGSRTARSREGKAVREARGADLAADLAELGAPDAPAGPGAQRLHGSPGERSQTKSPVNWLIVAVVVATLAALIGWLR